MLFGSFLLENALVCLFVEKTLLLTDDQRVGLFDVVALRVR